MKEVPAIAQNKFHQEFLKEVDDLYLKYGVSKIATDEDIKKMIDSEWCVIEKERIGVLCKSKPKEDIHHIIGKEKKDFYHNSYRTKVGDVIPNWSSLILPDKASDRYTLLKNLTAVWWFYYYKKDYLIKALCDNDIHSIDAKLYELDLFRKQELLTDSNKRNELYSEAQHYIHMHVYDNDDKTPNKQKELFIYILIDTDFFHRFLIPDKEFSDSIYHQKIAKVFGKYFLFYNYLLKQKKLLESIKIEELELISESFNNNLNDIFYSNAIERYAEFEMGFITDGWLINRKWKKEKNMLVSLILILEARGYFKPIRNKSESVKRLKYRRFFETRYNIDISKQMQPGVIKRFKLPESNKFSFQSIDAIQ